MTVNTTTNRVQYNGNGSTTVFSFPYKFTTNASLVVTITVVATGVDTVKTLTTHYTVSGAGDESGGNVTFLVAPATGERVTIERNESYVQITDYTEASKFPAESHEDALDKLTMLAQQLNDAINRTVKRKSTSASTADLSLPEPAADKVIGWNSSGTGLVNGVAILNLDNAQITGGDVTGLGELSADEATINGGLSVDGVLTVGDAIEGVTSIEYTGGFTLTVNNDDPGSGLEIDTNGNSLSFILNDDTEISAFAATLLEDDSATAMRTTLGGINSLLINQSAVAASVSATTSEETLATITIPANTMGANGSALINASFTYTNSANNKIMRIKFGGTTYKAITNTTSATQQIEVVVYNRGTANSQVGNQSQTITNSFDPSTNPLVTSAVDTTGAVTILITGQKASAGETLTLENFRVIVNYKA